MTKHIQKMFLLLAAAGALWGCSSGNSNAPALRNGHHPSDWVSKHGDVFLQNPNQCRTCHGDNLNEGGISGVSCGSVQFRLPNGEVVLCHGGGNANEAGPFGHNVEGFIEPTSPLAFHGNFAKGAPQMDPAAPFGFEECVDCHGRDFTGKQMPGPNEGDTVSSANCRGCHVAFGVGVSAPHSAPADWTTNHQMTDPANGETCGVCHYAGNNNPAVDPLNPVIIPEETFATPPTCFNSFLCHGQQPPTHPTPWPGHGDAAMAAPSPAGPSGFLTCNACHGSKFSGDAGNNAPACASCHGVDAPHPEEEIWLPVHSSTDELNASVCAWCHRKSDGVPGCFNNTLCHDGSVAGNAKRSRK